MTINIGMLSYLAGCISFAALSALMILSWRDRPFGRVLIIASTLTAIWAGVIVAGNMMDYPPIKTMRAAEYCETPAGHTACYNSWLSALAATLIFWREETVKCCRLHDLISCERKPFTTDSLIRTGPCSSVVSTAATKGVLPAAPRPGLHPVRSPPK